MDGKGLVLTSAFVDLHAHFREPALVGTAASSEGIAFPSETIESGCMAARAGGYGAVVCMANTAPPTDTFAAARALKERAVALGIIELFPALSITKGMAGNELAEWATNGDPPAAPFVVSEDGKDVYDDALSREALKAAAEQGALVSCHCDKGDEETAASKKAGVARETWSRCEENEAVERVLRLGAEAAAGASRPLKLHIAHVSTQEAADMVRRVKQTGTKNLRLSCEASPHHLALTEEAAARAGSESYGRVNPPLRREDDRFALINAVIDGTIDAIATDHAPHTESGKAAGSPGFSGLETAFSVCHTVLVKEGHISLKKLFSLMSAAPARILGLDGFGRVSPGFRACFAVIDPDERWIPDPTRFMSRGKNSLFAGKTLQGKVLAFPPFF